MGRPPKEFDDVLIFRIAELFFQGVRVRTIAERINEELQPQPPLTRESVYPLLARARELGFVQLVPPLEDTLRREVAEHYGLEEHALTVVRTPGPQSNAHVATAAAGVALELIDDLRKEANHTVTLGLGPGRASRDFSQQLAQQLAKAKIRRRLRLLAISGGAPYDEPQFASSSFFNLFPDEIVDARIGLFAPTMLTTREFKRLKEAPSASKVFALRDSIDLIVTSMGDFRDAHDLLRVFLSQHGVNVEQRIREGWIGNVQYRPYSGDGPILEKSGEYRAPTLFELDDFRKLIADGKHLLLIARQCGQCGLPRGQALKPLLENPRLRVWSRIVMDEATARDLLPPVRE